MKQDEFDKYVDKAIHCDTVARSAPAGPLPVMTPDKLARLTALLAAGRENVWYNSSDWGTVREAVKQMDHCECLVCKAMGRHSPARVVHHVKHLRDRPDLALSIYDPDTGARQLISVCKDCHERLHPESQRQYWPHFSPLTAERWD